MTEPVIKRTSSYGHVEIEWPNSRPSSVMVAVEILDQWADTMNEIAEIRRTGASLTADDIEARLPRTEAGIGGHLDLTDDDDRREMAHLLYRLLFPGNTVTSPVERRNQVDKHHTTPETGNRNTAPLPPPKPGTHESDLDYEEPPFWGPNVDTPIAEFWAAAIWSRANA